MQTRPVARFIPQATGTLVPHGSYGRKTPAGTRVRRFLCKVSGRTVSMLPDCLAAHLCGKLEEVERVVRAAEQATSRECAANTLWSIYEVSDYLGCGSYGSRVVPEVECTS